MIDGGMIERMTEKRMVNVAEASANTLLASKAEADALRLPRLQPGAAKRGMGQGISLHLHGPACVQLCERGRLLVGCQGEQSTNDGWKRRRRHSTRRTGKPSTGGRTLGEKRSWN
jgi:hypothetical protein